MKAHLHTLNKSIDLLIIANHVIEAFVIFTQNGLSISPNPDIKITNQSVQRKTNFLQKLFSLQIFFFLLRAINFDNTRKPQFDISYTLKFYDIRLKSTFRFFDIMLSFKLNYRIKWNIVCLDNFEKTNTNCTLKYCP